MNRTKLILALPIMVAILMGCQSSRPVVYGEQETRIAEAQFVSDLVGLEVRDYDGNDIATIEDFIIDPNTHNVVYAVVSFGRGWRKSGGEALVPHKALEYDPRENVVYLDAHPSIFEKTTFNYERDQYLLLEPRYKEQIYSYYGVTPDGLAYSGEPTDRERFSSRYQGRDLEARRQSISALQTIDGEVVEIGTYYPENGTTGVRYTIINRDFGTIHVLAGPRENVREQDFDVRTGDQIMVSGTHDTLEGRNVFIATKIKRGNQVLAVEPVNGYGYRGESRSKRDSYNGN